MKRVRGRLWALLGATVCAILLSGYLWLANQFPRAQEDTSGLGTSPIAVRVRGLMYAGPDDWTSEQLELWTARQCNITNVESARACASGLGMTCSDADPAMAVCTYHGVARNRMLNGRGPNVRRWRRGSITVTLTFTPPGPAMMHYATVVGFEDEAP